MNECIICKTESVVELLDVGMQPISNRFVIDTAGEEYLYPMVIGQCDACGLVQISNPVPAGELKPRYDWITYREPEKHLDRLAEIMCDLPGITRESAICGISFKDDSLLNRIEGHGFQHVWRMDLKEDLDIKDPRVGVETIQDRFNPEIARVIAHMHGRPDVVVARHILEHAHDMLKFMRGLKELVDPKGYIIIEVPDCVRTLEKCDYSAVWEEHVLYLTSETFRRSFTFSGFSVVYFESFPYALENCLVGIGRPQEGITPSFPSESVLEDEKGRALSYSSGLVKKREELNRFFSEYRQNQGKIAVFGAGHRSCKFINLLELREHVEFVADDNPNKQGLFMPGSRLPICGSAALLEKDIKLCLLSISPESEDKVIQNNQDFLEHGGTFSSIFPDSKHALQI